MTFSAAGYLKEGGVGVGSAYDPYGLRAWDSLFTMKHGVREVVGSIPKRGNILGEFFILPGYLVRFSL